MKKKSQYENKEEFVKKYLTKKEILLIKLFSIGVGLLLIPFLLSLIAK